MSRSRFMVFLVGAAGWVAVAGASGQSSWRERFSEHNTEMARMQPTMVTPIVTPDPRLIQYARFSVASEETAGGVRQTSFGNCRGAGIIAAPRFEFDWVPPPYVQHRNGTGDGAGDTAVAAKLRIASGNAEHGNFDVAAALSSTFATGSYTNGAKSQTLTPVVAGGRAFGRFDAVTSLGGTLPTGAIEQQGRSLAWNALVQAHATRAAWVEIENNATFFWGGPHDGKMQNFVTPGAFWVIRRPEWKPTHPYAVIAGGMQIATSGFHTYNHNGIAEVRVLF